MKNNLMRLATKALMLPLIFATAAGCTRITDREIGVKTDVNGRVTEEYKQGEGVVFYMPYFSDVHDYQLTMQTVQVKANEANLRTSDNQQVIGALDIQFQIDPAAGKTSVLYTAFNNNYETFIQQLAKDAAVKVFGKQSSINLTSSIGDITDLIRTHLQNELKEKQMPVTIVNIISNGVGLSEESNRKLEDVMLEQQRTRVLELRSSNADKAKDVVRKETEVTAEAVKAFRAAGVSEGQIPTMICLQMADKSGEVNKPFSPGCLGSSTPRVAVTAPGAGK